MSKMLLTPREASEALGLSVHTLRKMIRSGQLPAVHPTGRRAIRVRLSDILALVERQSR